MKNLFEFEINKFRDDSEQTVARYGSIGDDTCGCFRVPSVIDERILFVIASAGGGWEHVSVSRPNRCPIWREMEQIKRLFFKDDEVAVEYHVPPKDHINIHQYCLHLWRSIDEKFPMPPTEFV